MSERPPVDAAVPAVPAAPVAPARIPRCFRNDAELSRRDPYKQLLASLDRLLTEHPPDRVAPGGGLYYGPLSIAYLFFSLHPLYPELELYELPLTAWSAAYLERAKAHIKQYPGPKPQRCGISDDIMSLLALYAATARDADTVRELCDFATVATEAGASNEWLYGRAGYLYLLRIVRAAFRDDEDTLAMIEDTAEDVIGAMVESSRPWKWHDKAYLGAAHGAIGILTQIVLTDPSWAPKVEADVGVVLSYQYDGGNFPSSIPPSRDRMVQFCHGAPGVVSSLEAIKPFFPALQNRIERAIQEGRECIWERGLLTKEPCLCHGTAGNALALATKEMEHFLTYTTGHEIKSMAKDGMLEKSDDPSGLWCGEAGRAWAWAVADKALAPRYLGYNDI